MQAPRQRSGIDAEVLEGQLVLIDLASGDYHVLNSTGAVIWELCDGSHSPADIAQAVAKTYGIDLDRAQGDVAALLQNLQTAGLLRCPDGEQVIQ